MKSGNIFKGAILKRTRRTWRDTTVGCGFRCKAHLFSSWIVEETSLHGDVFCCAIYRLQWINTPLRIPTHPKERRRSVFEWSIDKMTFLILTDLEKVQM